MPVDKNISQITRAGLPEICAQKNVKATARDNIGQNIDKGYTPSPKIEMKIPDSEIRRRVGRQGFYHGRLAK